MKILETIRAWLAGIFARYDGAQYSPSRRWIQEEVQSARWDIDLPQRRELVRLSRNCEKNVGLVNKLVDVFEQYVVGQGLVIQPASSDEAWNAAAGEWWAGWTQLPDLVSRQELGTMLGLVARGWFIDGESFVLLTRGDSGTPRIQVVEAHLVETPPQYSDRADIIDGIRVDSSGRPISYFIATEKPDRSKAYAEVPADSVIHVFEPGRAGQYRGLPFLYPVMNTLRDLDLLKTLEMQAAKAAAQVTNVFKLKGGVQSIENLRKEMVSGTRTLSTGATVSTSTAKHFKDVTGAEPVVLGADDSFEQFSSQRPSVASREYWRMLEEDVCVGVGIPRTLVFPETMQGTVYRGALDMAASFFRVRSAVMQSALTRIWGYVMGWARYKVPTLRDAPADWRRIRITPPRAPNVDVGRNSRALLDEIGAGAKTFATAFSELGSDYRAELRQKAVEARMIRDLAAEFEIDPSEISSLIIDRPERVQTEVTSKSSAPDPVPVEGDEVKESEDEMA